MKKIFTIFILLLFPSSLLFSATNDSIALELSRSKKMQDVIKRMNSLYEYANSFIIKSTTKNIVINNKNLKKDFSLPDIIFKGYDSTMSISFDKNSQKIIFTNALPQKSSEKLIALVKNSILLHPRAKFDATTKKFYYLISQKAKEHIAKLNEIKNVTSNSYQEIPSIVFSKNELFSLKAPIGMIVYLKEDDKSAISYVKTEDGWAKVVTTSGNKLLTASVCNQNTLGAIKVSKEDACTKYCSFNNGKPEWRCFENASGENFCDEVCMLFFFIK
jgi:hypothetical protein